METLSVCVPYEYARERTLLSWTSALFGIDEGLLHPDDAIDLAVDYLAAAEEADGPLLELASASKGDSVLHFVKELAAHEDAPDTGAYRDQWLFLVLAWVLDNRGDFADPLAVVETAYADFGYPESIAGLVRYMPSDEPSLGGIEENEARLLDKWRGFVERESQRFARKP